MIAIISAFFRFFSSSKFIVPLIKYPGNPDAESPHAEYPVLSKFPIKSKRERVDDKIKSNVGF